MIGYDERHASYCDLIEHGGDDLDWWVDCFACELLKRLGRADTEARGIAADLIAVETSSDAAMCLESLDSILEGEDGRRWEVH